MQWQGVYKYMMYERLLRRENAKKIIYNVICVSSFCLVVITIGGVFGRYERDVQLC